MAFSWPQEYLLRPGQATVTRPQGRSEISWERCRIWSYGLPARSCLRARKTSFCLAHNRQAFLIANYGVTARDRPWNHLPKTPPTILKPVYRAQNQAHLQCAHCFRGLQKLHPLQDTVHPQRQVDTMNSSIYFADLARGMVTTTACLRHATCACASPYKHIWQVRPLPSFRTLFSARDT